MREAFHTYGSDKPDLRFGLPIADVTNVFASTEFKVFQSVIDGQGALAAIAATGCGDFSRKTIDELTAHVAQIRRKRACMAASDRRGFRRPVEEIFFRCRA